MVEPVIVRLRGSTSTPPVRDASPQGRLEQVVDQALVAFRDWSDIQRHDRRRSRAFHIRLARDGRRILADRVRRGQHPE